MPDGSLPSKAFANKMKALDVGSLQCIQCVSGPPQRCASPQLSLVLGNGLVSPHSAEMIQDKSRDNNPRSS
jgi:hypothetical protein